MVLKKKFIKNTKGFTLVEMLIVIVIIGILARFILPNLMGATDKANDVGKTTAMKHFVSTLINYAGDKGHYPNYCGSLGKLYVDSNENSNKNSNKNSNENSNKNSKEKDYKINDYIIKSKIPTDTNTESTVSDVIKEATEMGQFGYCAIKGTTGIPAAAYVLVAQVSDETKGNYSCSNNNNDCKINKDTKISDIKTSDKGNYYIIMGS